MGASGLKFSGRVLSVDVVQNGQFRVLLGPVPDVVSYVCSSDPPRLGAVVHVSATEYTTQPLKRGTLRALKGEVQVEVDDRPPVRLVSPAMVQQVQSSMRRPLKSYQAIGAAWMAERLARGKGAILADDPGLGKTTQTVATICGLGLFPAVIVCPSSLMLNWPKEFEHSRENPKPTIIEGRRGTFRAADIYFVSYGVLRHRETDIGSLRPACIVFDEAHELKEADASAKHRASVATRLAHYVRRVIAITGSPLMNHPKEFWRLLHIVDPQEWPSFEQYELRYLKTQLEGSLMKKRVVTERGRAEHVEELQVRTQACMLRRRKEEVATDLPPKTLKVLSVQLEPIDQKAYDEAEEDVVAWLRKLGQGARANSAAKTEALAKLSNLRRIASVGKLRRAVPMYLQAWFGAAKPAPLVVFGYHRTVLDTVREQAAHMGIRTVGIRGGDSIEARQQAVDEFQKGKADLFICPIRAGGVGINLQRSANSLMLERDWSPARDLQAQDRVHRMGQTRPVTITYMDAKDTVDEHVASVIAEKKRLIDSIIDGVDADSRGTQSIASGVLQLLAARGKIVLPETGLLTRQDRPLGSKS